MRVVLALASLLGLALAGTAQARDSVYHLRVDEVLQGDEAQSKLGNDVSFRFGTGSMPTGAQSLGTFVSNKKANSFGRPDEDACRRAVLSALIEFHERAEREGGNAVVNIVSYYQKVTYSSPTEYECHAGGFVAGVALQGTIVKLKKK